MIAASNFVLFCVLCLYVNAADGGFENADLCALVRGLNYAGLFFNADDLADNTANGGDLIANCQVVAHIVLLFFLLSLGADHYKVHNDQKAQ